MNALFAQPEWDIVSEFYSSMIATRSGVPKINHIIEGITIMERYGATLDAQRAYCLHPLFQNDEDLKANYQMFHYGVNKAWGNVSPYCVMLAMEYRAVANAFLANSVKLCAGSDPKLSVLIEVNQMLVADKVQNRKDFERHHLGKHGNSGTLQHYFMVWFRALAISEELYTKLIEGL